MSEVYTATTGGSQTCDLDSYDIGNTVSVSVQFADSSNNPIDPTTVILRIEKPDSTITVLQYPVGITKSGTGAYAYSFTPTQVGNYFYRWEGSGNLAAAADNQFVTNSSNVLS